MVVVDIFQHRIVRGLVILMALEYLSKENMMLLQVYIGIYINQTKRSDFINGYHRGR